jgi:hypothetical protein
MIAPPERRTLSFAPGEHITPAWHITRLARFTFRPAEHFTHKKQAP